MSNKGIKINSKKVKALQVIPMLETKKKGKAFWVV